MKHLALELTEIRKYIPQKDQYEASVSKANVAWHLSHMLMVIDSVCKAMQKSKPENYKSKFNLNRTLVFTLNKIPRGRGRSPKIVRPPDDISAAHIEQQLSEVSTALAAYVQLETNAHFTHPFFGMLNKKQAVKFLKIHTEHHLKIVREVLKKT